VLLAFSRYNELVEDRQARHIGDIIRERGNFPQGRTQIAVNRRAKDLTAHAAETNRHIFRLRKFFHLLLVVAVWLPLTIGRLTTLPLNWDRHRS
jgi:hypothetical protein